LADADVLSIGQTSFTDVAYNVIGDATTGADGTLLNSDDDLYIEGALEVDGQVRLNNLTYTFPSAQTANYVLSTDGTGTLSWSSLAANPDNYWRQTSGSLYPANTTVDLLVGATATASAKFAVINVNSGTPTASVSAGASSAGAAYLTAAGNLQTTQLQTLTLGGATTGEVFIQPNADTGDYFRFQSDATNLTLSTTDGSNLTITPAGTLNLNSTGDMTLDSSTDIVLDADGADVILKDAATTFATFTNSTTDLTLDIAGGDLILADADVLSIGQTSFTDVAYNVIGDATTGADGTLLNSDDDLYIEGALEVDGQVRLNNLTYTFPSAQTANYVLSTDGSGTLSWSSLAANPDNYWR
ncbi:MAG: hypothetical protein AABX58_03465, partial [Thermoproteota archaeon]